jgi:hypothetical protein
MTPDEENSPRSHVSPADFQKQFRSNIQWRTCGLSRRFGLAALAKIIDTVPSHKLPLKRLLVDVDIYG